MKCEKLGTYIPCPATKIWEFSSGYVTVYHEGIHTCPAKELETPEALPTFGPRTAGQMSDDIIIEELPKDDIDWDNIDLLADEKLKNLKKKESQELHPFGHSFKAVSILKEKCHTGIRTSSLQSLQ